MDLFFHALCGIALMQRSKLWMAALFGALPDIIGLGGIFGWTLYNYSHSLIGIAAVLLMIIILKLPIELIFFYVLHLIVDMPTHASGAGGVFYPLPVLVHVRGVDWWTNAWIVIIGYGMLLMLFSSRYLICQKYREIYRKISCGRVHRG